MRAQHTSIHSGDERYDTRPDIYQGECQRGVIDGWIAAEPLEDVEAVPLDDDICKASQAERIQGN